MLHVLLSHIRWVAIYPLDSIIHPLEGMPRSALDDDLFSFWFNC